MSNQRGFTLIELMIASLIGLIVMGGLMNLFITTNRSVALSDSLAQNQETGRFAMEYLTKFIRQAGYTEDYTQQSLPFLFVPHGRAGNAGFISCTADPEALACSANNPGSIRGDRLSIPFDVNPGDEARSCTGTIVKGSDTTEYYVNVFWVSATAANNRELRCQTYDKGANAWHDNAVTIINNVESMEFQVGVASNMNAKDAGRYVSVDKLIAESLLPNVRSVRIALLTTSLDATDSNKVNTTKKERIYSLLDAPYLTINDGNLRNIFSNTIPLVNAIETASEN